ncbi:hypothetical protein HZH68_012129 [Vespula germanica]|uniref:Uncharacterized protein n=1 Tax=Vespula germanica TaxID=30212 RepID=A0A834MYY7_VESGE|nr:hypothetical protein HZH68_012129 [Vespula germanica]
MILLKQKNAIHYGLPPTPAPKPPSPWSSILWSDERRPRGGKTARGARVMQLRDKVIAKDSGAGAPADDDDGARSCKSLCAITRRLNDDDDDDQENEEEKVEEEEAFQRRRRRQ